MKTIALCAGCGAVAFLAMSYQMGLFEEPAWPDGEPAQAAAEVSATARPSFPEDLAPACSGKPVAEARAYRAGSEPHPLAFFDGLGSCSPRGSDGLVRYELHNRFQLGVGRVTNRFRRQLRRPQEAAARW